MIRDFAVTHEIVNERIDKALVGLMSTFSRQRLLDLINDGKVLINDKQVKPSYRLKENDIIKLEVTETSECEMLAEDIPLDIIYEDDDIIVINKSDGMVVHPAVGHKQGTLVNALLAHCTTLSGINGVKRPGIVHRIDKDTSGLLVVAKNDEAHASLSSQLKDKTMHREYLALVKGVIIENEAKIIAPIGRSPQNRLKMCVNTRNGKDAVTELTVVKRYNQYTLISCLLKTGRTHQIRVHLSYIGFPIEGDLLYGGKRHDLYNKGQLLHAVKLCLIHPKTLKLMEFTAPLPKYFQDVIDDLNKSQG